MVTQLNGALTASGHRIDMDLIRSMCPKDGRQIAAILAASTPSDLIAEVNLKRPGSPVGTCAPAPSDSR
jgi:hypothetical protein